MPETLVLTVAKEDLPSVVFTTETAVAVDVADEVGPVVVVGADVKRAVVLPLDACVPPWIQARRRRDRVWQQAARQNTAR